MQSLDKTCIRQTAVKQCQWRPEEEQGERAGVRNVDKLHGPPMLVDKTNFGLVLYKHANFYRFAETSSYWLVKRISVFLCFSMACQ